MRNVSCSVVTIFSICFLSLGLPQVNATTIAKMNVADLTSYGDLIIVAKVLSLTDGFDGNGLPYTEVTVSISETLKGSASGTYSFRQFGLLAPRDMGDGMTYLGVSPAGWPKFEENEEVMVFLHQTTSLGFQSAAGLLQGKFNIKNKQIVNEINNDALFKNVSVDPGLLTEAEQKMLQATQGKCRAETFISFVRKAVDQDWFE